MSAKENDLGGDIALLSLMNIVSFLRTNTYIKFKDLHINPSHLPTDSRELLRVHYKMMDTLEKGRALLESE